MNIEARNQYMDTLRERYFKASKKQKGEILNEYCRNTKQEKKYAIKKFNYQVNWMDFSNESNNSFIVL